jgi:hypothetical protein
MELIGGWNCPDKLLNDRFKFFKKVNEVMLGGISQNGG